MLMLIQSTDASDAVLNTDNNKSTSNYDAFITTVMGLMQTNCHNKIRKLLQLPCKFQEVMVIVMLFASIKGVKKLLIETTAKKKLSVG